MTRAFVPASFLAFLAGTSLADVIARIRVADEGWFDALQSHLEWAKHALLGEIFLLCPFLAVALICRSLSKRELPRVAAALFFVAIATLLFYYVEGFNAAQVALLEHRWTASALTVGLLPFFIGAPVVAALGMLALIVLAIHSIKSTD